MNALSVLHPSPSVLPPPCLLFVPLHVFCLLPLHQLTIPEHWFLLTFQGGWQDMPEVAGVAGEGWGGFKWPTEARFFSLSPGRTPVVLMLHRNAELHQAI